jgi:hypothetical protein
MVWMKFLARTGGNMPATHVINVDLARVTDDGGSFLRYLAWGDFVEVVDDPDANPVRIRATRMVEERDGSVRPVRIVGTIKQPEGRSVVIPRDQSKVLKVNFVDVQQGDGTVIETPGGKLLLSTAATTSSLPGTWPPAIGTPARTDRSKLTASWSPTATQTISSG